MPTIDGKEQLGIPVVEQLQEVGHHIIKSVFKFIFRSQEARTQEVEQKCGNEMYSTWLLNGGFRKIQPQK